jgi:hypothetical protein
MYPLNRIANLHQAMLAGLCVLGVAGCASMNPFGNHGLASKPSESKFAAAANASTGISGQFKSMGTAVSTAVGKAKNAVTSTFSASSEELSDETSLAKLPTNLGPEIWVTNGHLYETQLNFAKAMDNYTKALEIQPNNESALLSTARLYARQGQHDKAVDFFNKAIAVAPQAATYNELALAQQKLGKMADAQAAITKAIELEPANTRYRNNLASMLVTGGRSDEAVKQLEQVFPPAVANYNVAYLHFTNSNVAAAQQHLQVALQEDPNLQQARDLMNRLGDSQTAQTASNAIHSAGQIYRTAQAAMAHPASLQQAPMQPAPFSSVPPPPGTPSFNGVPVRSGAVQATAVGLPQPTSTIQPGLAPQQSLIPPTFPSVTPMPNGTW